MGLTINKSPMAEAYFRISSYEVHRDKRQVRVRFDIYPSQGVRNGDVNCDWWNKGSSEIKLCEKEFIDYKTARTRIKESDVKKLVNAEIKKGGNNKKIDKKKVEEIVRNRLIAVEAQLIGTETMDSFINELDKSNSLETLYKYVKKTKDYVQANDT